MTATVDPGLCGYCGTSHLPSATNPMGRRCYYLDLRDELDGVEITPEQDRVLQWLAKWEGSTVAAVRGMFRAARAAEAGRKR